MNNTRIASLTASLVFLFTLGACSEPDRGAEPPADPPDALERILADRQAALAPGGRQCHEIRAVIPVNGDVQGPDCPDNKAVVNGWSEKCVQENGCNTPARLRELNAAAKDFCANWCAARRCDFAYAPRDACDSAWCMDSKFCRANCNAQKLDTCYFQQSSPNYNCECRDPPDTPPDVEG